MEAVERKSSRANDLLCHTGNDSKMAALALKAAHYKDRMRVQIPPVSTKKDVLGRLFLCLKSINKGKFSASVLLGIRAVGWDAAEIEK